MSNTYRVTVRVDTVQTFELQAQSEQDARDHYFEGVLVYDDIQQEEIMYARKTDELGPIAAELG